MENRLKNSKNHYIICGHGRIGRIVRERLEEEDLPFVVIDNNEENLEELRERNKCCFIEGDATQEDILIEAGIKSAKGLAALLPTDPDNLYLVMTVKLLNPSPDFTIESGDTLLVMGDKKAISNFEKNYL